MDKLTPDLLKMYRRKAVTPVIIEAKPGLFESVRSQLKSIVPISLLEAKFHTFLPRITPLIEFPLTKWKEIKTFSMIATVLTPELIEEVAQWRDVQRIYPDYIKWALSTVPPQGVFKDYKGKPFTSTFWTKKMMGLDRANAKGFTGKGITTVVIDSGARITHEQLRGRVRSLTAAPEKGMSGEDSNGHGTYCNSVVGGRYAIDRRYKAPVEGMAPDCNLISIQALGFIVGMGCSSDIIKAMELSIGLDAKCVSMSLGSDDAPKDEDNPEAKAINKLVEAGIIPCVAAGNAGPNPSTVGSPGSCLNSLTVAAWDELEGKVADFSSRGPTAGDGYIKPDVAAPGVRINSALVGFLDGITDPTQPHYGAISGTSMACLPPDTLIETVEGFKPIVEVHNPVVVPCYVDEKTGFGKVVSPVAMFQGLKKCYRLRTKYLELIASYDHPIFAVRKERMPNDSRTHRSITRRGKRKFILCGERRRTWLLKDRIEEIPLCELKPGDWILVKRRASFEGIAPDDCKDWTPDHWRLLGLCIADGCLNSRSRFRQVFWSQSKEETRNYYMNALKKLGYNVKGYKGVKFYVNSASLLQIYQKLIGIGGDKVGWTLKVTNLPLNCLRYVIQGYFDGDGWTRKDKNGSVQIGFSDKPENLKLLKLALLRFGVRTSVIKERKRESKKWGISGIEHYVLITGEDSVKFVKEIGSCVKKIYEKKPKPYTFKVGVRRFSEDYEFQRVEKIEEVEAQPVYDIRVDPDHNFIAEGIVVHNTPHCAGLVTCMAQLYREKIGRELTVDEVKRMMEKLGPNQPKDTNVGWGLITWDIVEQWVSTTYGVEL